METAGQLNQAEKAISSKRSMLEGQGETSLKKIKSRVLNMSECLETRAKQGKNNLDVELRISKDRKQQIKEKGKNRNNC